VEHSESVQSGQDELLGELEKVRSQLKELMRKGEDQKGLIEQQKEKIKDLKEANKSGESILKDNENLRNLINETKMEKLANEDELRRLKSKSDESEEVEKELREQIRSLTWELHETKKKLKQVDEDRENELQSKVSRFDPKMVKQVADLQTKVDNLTSDLKVKEREKKKLSQANTSLKKNARLHAENQRIIQADLMKMGLMKYSIPRKLNGEGSFGKLLKRFRLVNAAQNSRGNSQRKRKAVTPLTTSPKVSPKKRKKPIIQYLSDDEDVKESKKKRPRPKGSGVDFAEPKRKKRKRESVMIDSSPEESTESKTEKQNVIKKKRRENKEGKKGKGTLKRPSSHDDSGLSSMLQSSDSEKEEEENNVTRKLQPKRKRKAREKGT